MLYRDATNYLSTEILQIFEHFTVKSINEIRKIFKAKAPENEKEGVKVKNYKMSGPKGIKFWNISLTE